MHDSHDEHGDIRALLTAAALPITGIHLDPRRTADVVRARRRRRTAARLTAGAAVVVASTVTVTLFDARPHTATQPPAATAPPVIATGPCQALITGTTTPRPGSAPPSIAAMPPGEQAKYLAAVNRVAAAVQRAAPGHADVYSGMAIDPANREVHVWATGEAALRAIIDDARTSDPEADFCLVRVHRSVYPQRVLREAQARLLAVSGTVPYRITGVGVPADGSGLSVGIEDPAVADPVALAAAGYPGKDPATIAGVPVVIELGEPAHPLPLDGPPPSSG